MAKKKKKKAAASCSAPRRRSIFIKGPHLTGDQMPGTRNIRRGDVFRKGGKSFIAVIIDGNLRGRPISEAAYRHILSVDRVRS